MKNPTKAEKLRWTRKISNRVATGSSGFTCIAFSLHCGGRGCEWYYCMMGRYADDNAFPFYGPDKQPERLMWLAFLITLIEHGEPELTNL